MKLPREDSSGSGASGVDMRLARKIATLMDARFRIPGTGIRFGLDSLVGLIPVVGDAATALPSIYLLILAHRYRLPFGSKVKMGLNVLFDLGLGTVPVIGDVVDLLYKSNQRNFHILEQHIRSTSARRS